MAGDAVDVATTSDTRDINKPAVSESDLPQNIYDNDSAAALLEDNIDVLLGLTGPEDDEDDDDQGSDQSSSDHVDDPVDDQSQDDEEDTDDNDDTDDQNAEEDDKGDDQSGDDSEVENASGLFIKDENGKLKAASIGDVQITDIIDGEERTLTIAELKDGFMRDDDYTRKTQQLALRVEEGVEDGLREAHAKLDERAVDLEVILKTFTGLASAEPDFPALLKRHGGDVDRASAEYTQLQALKTKLVDAKKFIDQAKARETKDADKKIGEVANRTIKIVRESKRVKTPNGDRPMNEREFKRLSVNMNKYMNDQGLTRDQIIGGVLQSPAYVSIIEDAMQGRAHRERKEAMKQKRRSSAKRTSQTSTGKPSEGSPRTKNDRAHIRKKSKDTGSVEASLQLIEGLLP